MKVAEGVKRGTDSPTITIVVPLLNEAENIPELCSRLCAVLEQSGEPWEIIAIDDGSTDETLALLRVQQEERPQLRVISFARNFGQHAAVMAGFEAARGRWIITIDGDLQNPPEEIPKLLQALRNGHDLVNTVRVGRQDTLFRKAASGLINRIARRISGIQLRDFGCMLRGYDWSVVEPMLCRREFHTFIPALAMLHARKPIELPVAHSPRLHGSSTYSLWRLFRLQLDLVTSFSLAPLRLLFTLGACAAAAGVLLGLFLLVMRLIHGPEWAVSGVFTLFAVLFLFVGAQFVAFGLLGEYIGRIYEEVRRRPTYVVRDGGSAEQAAARKAGDVAGAPALSRRDNRPETDP
ncbi:MAG: glycosyltransferase [Planctomycetota bacterium]